jgi:hypothetical protein
MADPVSREQFDADLAADVAATNDYIAAVDAFIALPPVVDLAEEDAAVKASLDAVNAAKSRSPRTILKP